MNNINKIAIPAGGDSSEEVVSVKSAAQIAKVLDRTKYEPYIINIKGSDWHYIAESGEKIQVDKNDFSVTVSGEKIVFDCVVIAIHGTPGENGVLQAYFDLINMPYIGCNHITSAVTFDKYITKAYLKDMDINMAKAILVRKNQQYDIDEIISKVGLPCVVKPNNGGSSFGVTIVKQKEGMENALINSFKEDWEVLIEEFIKGTEVTCGIAKTSEQTIALPPTEIVPKNEFFDYEAKYLGASEEITPARLSDDKIKLIQDTTSRVYDIFNCKGIVRVDYILKEDKLYFIEINTIPGMSEASIVPQEADVHGIGMAKLFDLVIEELLKSKVKS